MNASASPRQLRVSIDRTFASQRLDKVAHTLWKKSFPDSVTSRSEVQRWVDLGLVTIDGSVMFAAYKVCSGSVLEIHEPAPLPTAAIADPTVPFEVIYQDEHLVVVDKPPGVVVHPARSHQSGTLVNGLIARGLVPEIIVEEYTNPPGAHDSEISSIVVESDAENDDDGDMVTPATTASSNNQPQYARPGIVHRIDRDTSGLLVIARTAEAREGLKVLFAKHDLDREYIAFAVGKVKPATIRTRHARNPKDRMKFTSHVLTGKPAITHVSVEQVLPCGVTIVRCRLETGRTHQIRVHLTEIAQAPILGDKVYGRPPRDSAVREIGETLGRQALHAAILGFVHPITGKKMRWQSPLPTDMQTALDSLIKLDLHSKT